MTMRDKAGLVTSTVATITLGEVQVIFGMLMAMLTCLFLLPGAVKSWRELVADWRTHDLPGFVGFIMYCLARVVKNAPDSKK